MENPWNIQSIYELQYFNCPSCSFKDHSKQELISHAYELHPDCVDYLIKIKDDSLKEVMCPWDEIRTEVKLEETFSDENIEEPYFVETSNLDISGQGHIIIPIRYFCRIYFELICKNCFKTE